MSDDRYQVMEVVGGERRLLAAAPDGGGIGVALVTLREDGDIGKDSQIGILDADEHRWVINPYARSTR